MNYSFAEYIPQIIRAGAGPPKKSWAWAAWLVILLLVGLVVLSRGLVEKQRTANGEDKLGSALMEVQARYLIGAADLLKQGKKDFFHQALALNQGPVDQRLRSIALAGELGDPGKAQELLQEFDQMLDAHHLKLAPAQARCRDILAKLYGDYRQGKLTAPSVAAADRDYLRQSLGWFGDLALAPAGLPLPEDQVAAGAGAQAAVLVQLWQTPNLEARQSMLAAAHRTFIISLSAMLAAFFLGMIGFLGLICFFVYACSGGLHGELKCGTGHGGIYAETFAVWLVLFGGLHFPLLWLGGGGLELLGQALTMLLSLLALAWPVLRGIPWRQVRQEIGLTLGPRPAVEPLIGVACYVMSLPLVAAGLIVTLSLIFVLRSLEGQPADPFVAPSDATHPLVEALVQTDWWQKVQLLFLASVVAPLVEETMFRGVLYRHLREAGTRYSWLLSALFSATVVSFLFALLHPQGLVAVPLLMALAYGFALAREWRDTLIPAMVGHGLSNGLVTLLAILAFGS